MPITPNARRFTLRRPPSRPAAHHKFRETEGVWFLALRMLWKRGWADRDISLALCDLSAEAIGWLRRTGRWAETDKMTAPDSGRPWTRRQVEYWRRRLGLKGRHPRHDSGGQEMPARIAQNMAAVVLGWGHLTPLTPAELRIVEVLSDGEPRCRAELEGATGYNLTPLTAGRRTPLRRLVDRQIVALVQLGYGGGYPLYSLMPGVARRQGGNAGTGMERLATRIGDQN